MVTCGSWRFLCSWNSRKWNFIQKPSLGGEKCICYNTVGLGCQKVAFSIVAGKLHKTATDFVTWEKIRKS